MSSRIYVISDTHFGHEALVKHIKAHGQDEHPIRGQFATVKEMDDFIITQWNETVRQRDHVWHLGDVAMRKPYLQIVKQLHGHKTLIAGNHDIFDTKDYLNAGFANVRAMRVWENLLLTHIPVHQSSLKRFLANIHGHLHDKPTPGPDYICVSCEAVSYTPVPVDSLLMLASRRKQALIDRQFSAPLRITLGELSA